MEVDLIIPSIFPGRPSFPKYSRLFKASANLDIKPARPSRPATGLLSEACSPLASCCADICLSPILSTWQGTVELLLNIPALNISRLATARPSLRR